MLEHLPAISLEAFTVLNAGLDDEFLSGRALCWQWLVFEPTLQ
jgi:hypothetical protein